MAENRVFVSGDLIQRWVSSGGVELGDAEIRVRGGAGSGHPDRGIAVYGLEEAVHVLSEVTCGRDAHDLVGRVRSVRSLAPLQVEILERSMIVGELAYDVVLGFLLSPVGPKAGSLPRKVILSALAGLSDTRVSGDSDEDLLARYLIEKLE
jgi:hypothetical protein